MGKSDVGIGVPIFATGNCVGVGVIVGVVVGVAVGAIVGVRVWVGVDGAVAVKVPHAEVIHMIARATVTNKSPRG
jgi:hypothetical protein